MIESPAANQAVIILITAKAIRPCIYLFQSRGYLATDGILFEILGPGYNLQAAPR